MQMLFFLSRQLFSELLLFYFIFHSIFLFRHFFCVVSQNSTLELHTLIRVSWLLTTFLCVCVRNKCSLRLHFKVAFNTRHSKYKYYYYNIQARNRCFGKWLIVLNIQPYAVCCINTNVKMCSVLPYRTAVLRMMLQCGVDASRYVMR